MAHPSTPTHCSLRTAAALGALAMASCDSDERLRRTAAREAEALLGFDVVQPDSAVTQIPRDPNPAITESEAIDVGSAACPATRVLRVERRNSAAPAGSAALTPRFYGRREDGRILPIRELLLCELRAVNWLAKGNGEGSVLILWRGPYVFEPEGDCDWREPLRTETIVPGGGRRIYFHEHCRRHARPGPSDRAASVEVNLDYTQITFH